MIPLIVGSLLAVAGVAYVLMPLMRAAAGGTHNPAAANAEPNIESSAIEALREIEFDQATGKLSADDYTSLKAQYTPRALAELRARESAATASNAEFAELAEGPRGAAVHSANSANSAFKAVAVSTDAAEAFIAVVASRGLVCPIDGPRPESDALFCSECGRELVAAKPTSAAAAR